MSGNMRNIELPRDDAEALMAAVVGVGALVAAGVGLGAPTVAAAGAEARCGHLLMAIEPNATHEHTTYRVPEHYTHWPAQPRHLYQLTTTIAHPD